MDNEQNTSHDLKIANERLEARDEQILGLSTMIIGATAMHFSEHPKLSNIKTVSWVAGVALTAIGAFLDFSGLRKEKKADALEENATARVVQHQSFIEYANKDYSNIQR